jgi:hypothetical protein
VGEGHRGTLTAEEAELPVETVRETFSRETVPATPGGRCIATRYSMALEGAGGTLSTPERAAVAPRAP